ncbi:MAG TPA: glycosyltransferase [Kineosporiaceae bacterium]|nr:glycosyltransferase [Kineosporiaceae bacterium]
MPAGSTRPGPGAALPHRLVAGFETTYAPLPDVDNAESTGHDRRWREDLAAVHDAGVRDLRYPLRWHRIEREPGTYDWRDTDAVLGYLRDLGMRPIVDLVHHTSYPAWLTGGFGDPRFGPAYERYAAAVAERYPWLGAYTLFNEPLATLFLAGHEALWPPYGRGVGGLAVLLRSVLPSLVRVAALWRETLPAARHVWVDTCEHHAGGTARGRAYAELANDRRFGVLDLVLGRDLDDRRPFLRDLARVGAQDLLEVHAIAPVAVDVLGLDYYVHSEWWYDERGGHAPSPAPVGLAALAQQYHEHTGLPLALTETNIRGLPTDQVTWFRLVLAELERAAAAGVPVDGVCWFPHVDSCDWDSLLARGAGRRDPVGVLALGPTGARRPTVLTRAWQAVAAGARAADLPAYRPQPPVTDQLAGYAPWLRGWPWTDPPPGEVVRPVALPAPAAPRSPEEDPMPRTSRTSAAARTAPRPDGDLVVLSHLRWQFVWQRPQHLVTRITAARADRGARTWFVEEPWAKSGVTEPRLASEERDGVTRVWLELPARAKKGRLDFGGPACEDYAPMLLDMLREQGAQLPPLVWLYTPMALDIAEALEPGMLVYDVMDDLSAFAKAPQGLRLLQRRALRVADVVLAGGRSLHAGVAGQRPDTHLFPSGVDSAHYARSRSLRRAHRRPVAGFVGVVDERMDLDLVRDVAALLPDWDFRIVGPVAKISRSDLPKADNIRYLGKQEYEDLPKVMARFDVALMPFALNDATRSISPTKTLEYLAAGLPVVSTPVADVVADFGSVVHVASGAEEFAAACTAALAEPLEERDRRLRRIESRYQWDDIAGRIHQVMLATLSPSAAAVPARRTGVTA